MYVDPGFFISPVLSSHVFKMEPNHHCDINILNHNHPLWIGSVSTPKLNQIRQRVHQNNYCWLLPAAMKGFIPCCSCYSLLALLCVRERANARTCSLHYAPVHSSWLGCSSALLILCLVRMLECSSNSVFALCSLQSSTLIHLLFSSVLSDINIRRPLLIGWEFGNQSTPQTKMKLEVTAL